MLDVPHTTIFGLGDDNFGQILGHAVINGELKLHPVRVCCGPKRGKNKWIGRYKEGNYLFCEAVIDLKPFPEVSLMPMIFLCAYLINPVIHAILAQNIQNYFASSPNIEHHLLSILSTLSVCDEFKKNTGDTLFHQSFPTI